MLLTLLRLFVAQRVGLGDAEAYYWTWSRELAWGYFDHGPAVAFLIWMGTLVLGPTPLGVRFTFILLSALTLWLCGWLAARLAHDGEAGLWAVVGLMAIPVFFVAGAAANPDVPFSACTILFLLTALFASEKKTWGWLILASFLVGIGICAKLFALVLLLPLLLAAWSYPRRWPALASALAAALLGALPVLIWNVSHNWASLRYHLQDRHAQAIGFSLTNVAKLVGGQLGYLTPLVLIGLGAAAVALWRQRQALSHARLFLWTALPLLFSGFLLILFVPNAEPHWPSEGYLPLVVFLGTRLPHWLRSRRCARPLLILALAFSALLVLIFHIHVLTSWGIHLMPARYIPRYDLTNELRGWPQVASGVLEQMSRRKNLLVAACHYTTCSQLAFAAQGRFPVLCPSPRRDQFDFTAEGDGSNVRGADVLYVKDERFPYDASSLYHCDEMKRVSTIKIYRAGRVVRQFDLQICQRFMGLRSTRWPPS